MSRFWTSDIHWGHHNVIEYCKRPYHGIHDMNAAIRDNWNCTVSPVDDVYYLGDWSMAPKWLFMLKYLSFNHLYWVLGNHDKESKIRKMLDDPGSEVYHLRDKITIAKEMMVDVGGTLFHLVHRPIMGSDIHPVICGHVHEKWKLMPAGSTISEHSKSKEAKDQRGSLKVTKTPILNVGVDVHNFFPISDEQLLEYFK